MSATSKCISTGSTIGAYALRKVPRDACAPIWVRAPKHAPSFPAMLPSKPPRGDPDGQDAVFYVTRRCVIVCDTRRLSDDTARPRSQQLQWLVLHELGIDWLDESVVTLLPIVGRFATARVDLSGIADRLDDIDRRPGAEEREWCHALHEQLMKCCAERATRHGCISGVWLIDDST